MKYWKNSAHSLMTMKKGKKQRHTFLICCYFLTVVPSLVMSSGQLHHHGGSSSHLMFWSIHTIGITHCRELNSTSHNIQIKFNENQCSRSQILHVYRQLDKVNFIGSPQRCCERVYKVTVCLYVCVGATPQPATWPLTGGH
jgi:hypothetical protein